MLNLLLSDLIVPEVGPKKGISNIFNYTPRSNADVFLIICWVCSMTMQLKLKCQKPQSCFPVFGSMTVQEILYATPASRLVISVLQRVPHRRIAHVAAFCSMYFVVGGEH